MTRLTISLGSLYKPLAAAAKKAGRTLAEEIRQRLARSLRVEAPDMEPGNPEIGKEAKKGAKARWNGSKRG